MENIAIFGGSFDPPHLGHIAIVEKALQTLDIKKLIIVPAYLNPFKSHAHAPAALRLKWLKSIFADYADIEISDFEIMQNRTVRSIETVRHFLPKEGKLYLIIGADNLASLKQWYRFDELDRLVTWVIATRDKILIPPGFITLDIDKPVSSTELRGKIQPHALPKAVAQEIEQFYKETDAKKN